MYQRPFIQASLHMVSLYTGVPEYRRPLILAREPPVSRDRLPREPSVSRLVSFSEGEGRVIAEGSHARVVIYGPGAFASAPAERASTFSRTDVNPREGSNPTRSFVLHSAPAFSVKQFSGNLSPLHKLVLNLHGYNLTDLDISTIRRISNSNSNSSPNFTDVYFTDEHPIEGDCLSGSGQTVII